MKYTVNRSYKITFTKSSGFTYTVTSSKASVTAISNPSGFVVGNTKVINVRIELGTLDAYNNNVITVTAIDKATGCTIVQTDNLTKLSPCLQVKVNIADTSNSLTYKATVTGGNNPYTYKWSFNNTNFEAIGNTTSDTLNLRNIIDVTPFSVGVEVTDANGCKATRTVSYSLSCKPAILNITATNTCTNIEGIVYNKYTITLTNTNTGCGDLVQELIPLDSSFINKINSLGNNKYELVIDRSFPNNIKQFYVKNSLGYKSNDFGVYFNKAIDCTKKIDCVTTIANNNTITLGSTYKETNTEINVIGDDVDYTTFKFIAVSPQKLTSNTELNTELGTAIYNPATRIIQHIFTNTGVRNDVVINWSISDKCGNIITKTLTIKTKLVIVPNVSSKQNKIIKGKTATINIDGVDSLSIVKNPTSGSSTASNNILTYNSNDIGTYSFDVIPSNETVTGNLFNVSYEVVSSGIANDLDFCDLGLINLSSYLTGASSGGNWYKVNNTVPISQSNQVDFSTQPIGTYQFQYVVTAGNDIDTTTVTFNKYKFDVKTIRVIPAQSGAYKVTIEHEGLLINDIRSSVYILNGVITTINLDTEESATSFSFTIITPDVIRNLTYSITTVCGIKSISYTRPDVMVSTYNITAKSIVTATLTKQAIKLVSASVIGKGIFLTNPVLTKGNQVVCTSGMDVVFVLDYTSSMGGVINNIKANIVTIKDTIISESNNDYRLGLVIFDEDTTLPSYNSLAAYTSLPSGQKIVESGTSVANGATVYQYITAMETMSANNGDTFTTQLNKLNTGNMPLGSGVGLPEPMDRALYHIAKTTSPITNSFRNNVAKLVILITDNLPSGNDDGNTSADLNYINNTLTPLFVDSSLKLLLLSTSSQTQLMNLVTASNGVYVNSFNAGDVITTIQNICI